LKEISSQKLLKNKEESWMKLIESIRKKEALMEIMRGWQLEYSKRLKMERRILKKNKKRNKMKMKTVKKNCNIMKMKVKNMMMKKKKTQK